MRPLPRTLEALHAIALTLWFAALAGAALAAAIVFPTMKSLSPHLTEFEAYTGDHWMIAAGHVGRRVFMVSDRVELVCAAIAVVSLAWITRLAPSSRWSLLVRWAGVGVAASFAIYHGLVLSPRMDSAIQAYWTAARAGENERAGEFRAQFTSDHPRATRVLVLQCAGVLLALTTTAASRGKEPVNAAAIVRG